MKKLSFLVLLPVVALTACGKQIDSVVPDTSTPTPPSDTSAVPSETATEALNPNIDTTTQVSTGSGEVGSFSFTYIAPDGKTVVPVSGKMEITDGKIRSFTVDGANIDTPKTPIDSFAKNAPAVLIGKEVKGLNINAVSGASYVTKGFNDYLKNIQ